MNWWQWTLTAVGVWFAAQVPLAKLASRMIRNANR